MNQQHTCDTKSRKAMLARSRRDFVEDEEGLTSTYLHLTSIMFFDCLDKMKQVNPHTISSEITKSLQLATLMCLLKVEFFFFSEFLKIEVFVWNNKIVQ